MNSKSTIWLLAVALGLFGYIYFFELRSPTASQRAKETGKLLPAFDPSKVSAVEIGRSNQTLRVERVNDQWQLANPVYPAQSTAIASLLEDLTQLHRQSEIPAAEIISQSYGLSPFGLDPPVANIKIQEGTNLIQLRVGAKTVVGDRVYVQPAGASGIYTTEATLLDHLPTSTNQWRNALLMEARHLNFDHIAITSARPLKLERDPTNQVWRLIEPGPMRADFDRVQSLIRELNGARVNQFVTDDAKADLEPYGLLTPAADVALAQGTNVVFQVQIGKSPTNDPNQVYARLSGHSNVVLVAKELADLVEKPYAFYRDRMLLSLRGLKVDRIEAHVTGGRSEESFAIQRQGTNDWQVTEPVPIPADQQLIQLFLQALNTFEIVRVEKDAVAEFSPYGLTKPPRSYFLKASVTNGAVLTNQPVLRLDFGVEATNELGVAAPDTVYCRRSDEQSVYVVKSSDLGQLPGAAFELRDRQVWRFASSNVWAVTMTLMNNKLQWSRDPASGRWDKIDKLHDARIEETLHRLGALQTEKWVAKGPQAARQFGASPSHFQLLIELREQGQPRQLQLEFGKISGNGDPYAVVTLEENQPVVFKFPLSLYRLVAGDLAITTPDPNL